MEKKPPPDAESRTAVAINTAIAVAFTSCLMAFQDGTDWLFSVDTFYNAPLGVVVVRCIVAVILVLALHVTGILLAYGAIIGVMLVHAVYVQLRYRLYRWRHPRKGPTP